MSTTTTTTTIAGSVLHLDAEGFLTDPHEWTEEVAGVLAERIGISLTDEHWEVIRFARADFAERGETPTLRRISTEGRTATKELFRLFPMKPAKKIAYVAGLPKPRGCV